MKCNYKCAHFRLVDFKGTLWSCGKGINKGYVWSDGFKKNYIPDEYNNKACVLNPDYYTLLPDPITGKLKRQATCNSLNDPRLLHPDNEDCIWVFADCGHEFDAPVEVKG